MRPFINNAGGEFSTSLSAKSVELVFEMSEKGKKSLLIEGFA